MYVDEYVVSGVLIVLATLVTLGGMGYFGWKHIKQDIEHNASKTK